MPLALAALAALVGAAGIVLGRKRKRLAFYAVAFMMVLFFHAARLALVVFDPYLGSKPLADALVNAPPGKLIEADAYYAFSSVFFYTNRTALLWDGRAANLEYGSYAPGAPNVFIDDAMLKQLWCSNDRYYLLADEKDLPRVQRLVGASSVYAFKKSGGKCLVTNKSLG